MRVRPISCRLSILAAFVGTLAWAGAEQDTERAEQSLRNGELVTAISLLRKAAEVGHAPAQARLADLLDVAEQDAQAVELYRLAAQQGNAAGEFGLGRMLAQGEGVERDVKQGLSWIQRAAEKGHTPAVEWLARAYRAGDLGLPRDAQEAARLEARARALRSASGEAPR